jgi:hypothetical protein
MILICDVGISNTFGPWISGRFGYIFLTVQEDRSFIISQFVFYVVGLLQTMLLKCMKKVFTFFQKKLNPSDYDPQICWILY